MSKLANIWKAITSRNPRVTAQVAEVVGATQLRRQDLVTPHSPTDQRDLALIMRGMRGTAYHAATLNATAASGCKIRLYRPGSEEPVAISRKAWLSGRGQVRPNTKAMDAVESGDVEEVCDHPALNLLREPDPILGTTNFFMFTFVMLELTGRMYWQIVRDESGLPIGLVAQAPHHVRIIADAQTMIGGYLVGVQSPGLVVPTEDMVYVRYWPHPFNPLQASTWLESVIVETDCEAAALESERARWNNGGQPSMVFEVPVGYDMEKLGRHREEMMREVRGTVNAGNPLFTNMKLIPNAVPPKDMEYVNGLGVARERIYAAAGIPDTVWKVSDSNRASATVGHPQWLTQTIVPRLNIIAEMLTERLLPNFPGTEGWFFAYDNPVQTEVDSEFDRVQKAAAVQAATPNEVRSVLGYENVEGGDAIPLSPAQSMELTRLVTEVDAGRLNREAGIALARSVAPQIASLAESMFPVAAAAAPVNAPLVVQRAVKVLKFKANARTVAKAFPPGNPITAALEQALGRNIAAVTLQAIRPDGSFDDAKFASLMEGVADRMGDLYRASFDAAASDLGESLAVGDDVVSKWIEERGLELSRSVPDTIKQQVANRLADLTASGDLSVSEAVSAIRDEVPDIAASRAEAIARTETSLAFNRGRVDAFAEAGLDTKTWAPAGGPCPICDAFAAKYEYDPIDVSKPFVVSVQGKSISVIAPPAHPNCRCSVEPGL